MKKVLSNIKSKIPIFQSKSKEPKKPISDSFANEPVWKIMLKMCIPAFVIAFFFGAYTFADSLLSVAFAPDYYLENFAEVTTLQQAQDIVRNSLLAITPINMIIFSFAFLFSIGTASRAAVNLGRGDIERAKKTVSTGNMFGFGTFIILIPILILAARPWIGAQYPSEIIQNTGFDYAWIIIIVGPVFYMNQMFNVLLRNDGKNGATMVAQIIPTFVNLFFDWIFMGLVGMGVEGGAIATAIAYLLTFFISAFAAWRADSQILRLKILFNFRIKVITFFGILLIGISPFLRNVSFSLVQTLILSEGQRVSQGVYGNSLTLNTITSSVFPISVLAFVSMMGIIQGGLPVIAFNYGSKNFERVKKSYFWALIYSGIIGILSYIIVGIALGGVLLSLLAVSPENYTVALNGLRIWLLVVPLFAPNIAAIILATATERILYNIIVSISYSVLGLVPSIFIFGSIAIANPNSDIIYWFINPSGGLISSLICTPIVWRILHTIDKDHETIEDKINKIYKFFHHKVA